MNSLTAAIATSTLLAMPLTAASHLLFVGTYTGPKSEGIHAFRFDDSTGATEAIGLVARTENPTFLAIHPNGRFLYAANETGKWKGQDGGYVTAYAIDTASGRLRELGQQSTVGGGPCHLSTDPAGRQLMVANYGGGSTVSLPILADGSVGPHNFFAQHRGSSVNKARQGEPHAHSVNLGPEGRFAWVADLGTDRVLAYAFEPSRGLVKALPQQDAVLEPGSGPRHLAFSPDGRNAYVINELLSTVTTFAYDGKAGRMTPVETVSTLPPGHDGKDTSTAEVRVHPGGRFVFGSNRGHDSIAVFQRDPGTGRLKLSEITKTGGKTPRNFNFDPTGKYLFAAGQNSHDIRQFRIDPQTGSLIPTGLSLSVGSPVCLRFVTVP